MSPATTESTQIPFDQSPAALYLGSLEFPTSRRTMRQVLDTIAKVWV